MRKSSSDRLFMLKRDVSLAEHLTGFKVYAQELLSVKVKRQIGSKRQKCALDKQKALALTEDRT